MAINDAASERLFVTADLAAGAEIVLSPNQAHYLTNVLRMKAGAEVLVFNGRDGEWRASIEDVRKKAVTLLAVAMTRPQASGPDITYAFAPLKRSRLDYLVQKATEMGAATLQPVLTERTIAERVNLDRMSANVIEAAEQCGVLRVPQVRPPTSLATWLRALDADVALVVCDEAAKLSNPIDTLRQIDTARVAIIVGPEGGFAPAERALLLAHPRSFAISLGPRIMRADTAAVAALALVNATIGDWR